MPFHPTLIALLLVPLLALARPGNAAVPAGFQDTIVATGVTLPSVLAFAPDGRLFIGEVVDGYNGARGAFSLSITPPTDGTCNAPFVIPASGGVVTGTTSGTSGLGGCSCRAVSPEKVYRWTPSTSGTATLETCGGQTNYDTVLYIAAATCGGASLACVDDTPGCGTTSGPAHGSRVTPTVTAGQTYYVVDDGYDGRAGNYSLSVIPPP